jgi:hypothetical protein
MDAFLHLLLMLQQPSSSLASDHRSHLHRPRPATQPAARAATFIVPDLLRPSVDAANTRVSGLTRCSGNPADTGLFAVHATDFVAPDLLLTQPLSSLVTSTSLLCRWSSVPASRFQLELPDHQLQPPTSINQSIKEPPDHQLQPPTSMNQSIKELPDHQLQPPTSINQSIKELPDHQLQPPTSINQSIKELPGHQLQPPTSMNQSIKELPDHQNSNIFNFQFFIAGLLSRHPISTIAGLLSRHPISTIAGLLSRHPISTIAGLLSRHPISTIAGLLSRHIQFSSPMSQSRLNPTSVLFFFTTPCADYLNNISNRVKAFNGILKSLKHALFISFKPMLTTQVTLWGG